MTNSADPDQLASEEADCYTVYNGGAYQGSAGPGLTLACKIIMKKQEEVLHFICVGVGSGIKVGHP